MTNDLLDAWNRLVPPCRLHQVAALLNMPPMDETAAHDDNAPRARQLLSLYTELAEWAKLSARAVEQLDVPDAHASTERFAYLIEYTDQYAKGWHRAPSDQCEGVTVADSAEAVAQTVLPRYITHLAGDLDNYELWLTESFSLRVSVWHMDSAAAHRYGRRSAWPPSAQVLQDLRIPPQAVEIRTPSQINRIVDLHNAPG
ncbi:hypothetical protein HCN51_46605 [Nonomuraea sp. FMUSA5-5]|uniref:Uncharacterized protein n=1 Tax=Nonomuraea composti TaxID=2720023 RepID=A0ABX1BJX5_9ACTN|nr:hypothetical protein [Nonomuraea sp. FMUSA5-5]NJP96817.1 hypothetical protein [Nonomuraea sp. FMUSA5-5]